MFSCIFDLFKKNNNYNLSGLDFCCLCFYLSCFVRGLCGFSFCYYFLLFANRLYLISFFLSFSSLIKASRCEFYGCWYRMKFGKNKMSFSNSFS